MKPSRLALPLLHYQMMKSRFPFITLLFVAVLLTACEDNMWLRSEKKLKEKIQGTWEREMLGDTNFHFREQWIFSGDMLHTVYYELDSPDLLDSGTKDSVLSDNADTVVKTKFTIDTRITRAFLKLQLIDRGVDTNTFVDKWEFVELDDKVLYLATDDPVSNSVLQREFFKVK